MKNPQTGKPFKMGDRVKEGQVIIRLEDEEYENSIAIESAKLNLEISEEEYNKQKSLYEKGGVTLYGTPQFRSFKNQCTIQLRKCRNCSWQK